MAIDRTNDTDDEPDESDTPQRDQSRHKQSVEPGGEATSSQNEVGAQESDRVPAKAENDQYGEQNANEADTTRNKKENVGSENPLVTTDKRKGSGNGTSSTEDVSTRAESGSLVDPLEGRKSYGNFANLAAEFDARSRSREIASQLNASPDASTDQGLADEKGNGESGPRRTASTEVTKARGRGDGESVAVKQGGAPSDADQRIEFNVDDESLREHIDPGSHDDLDSSIDVEPVPRGDRIADEDSNAENDRRSRADRLRQKLARGREDALDGLNSTVNDVQGIFDRPPTGSYSVVKTDRPIISAPQGASAGDVATALVSGAIVLGELYRWGHGKLANRTGERDGDNR